MDDPDTLLFFFFGDVLHATHIRPVFLTPILSHFVVPVLYCDFKSFLSVFDLFHAEHCRQGIQLLQYGPTIVHAGGGTCRYALRKCTKCVRRLHAAYTSRTRFFVLSTHQNGAQCLEDDLKVFRANEGSTVSSSLLFAVETASWPTAAERGVGSGIGEASKRRVVSWRDHTGARCRGAGYTAQ